MQRSWYSGVRNVCLRRDLLRSELQLLDGLGAEQRDVHNGQLRRCLQRQGELRQRRVLHSYCSESLCSESDFSCGPTNDNLCYNHGDCRCGNCICHPTHTGEFCDCPTATERCDPSGSGDMCSGRGRCECNECVCDRKDGNFWFFGDTCQYCKVSNHFS
ncbi:hypothetical protein HAZT_HAZT005774 [Hyalella azteca]|uniref:EGF-like domain-containing protein n=1 Tax=Hyalella azteca TaxID=294128 RepID=A0A6A0HBI7_HYAAZ|nr:hypothetical protein HAZT_HAZT005774 [Hyalella azteca]